MLAAALVAALLLSSRFLPPYPSLVDEAFDVMAPHHVYTSNCSERAILGPSRRYHNAGAQR